MILTREQILAAKLKIAKVTVPEWDGEVYVRELTAKEQELAEERVKANGKDNAAWVASLTLCDELGNNLFTEKDIPELSKLSGNVLTRVILETSKLSGLDESAVKELQKN